MLDNSRWSMGLAIAVGLALGVGSAWWAMAKAGARGFERNGWVGSTDAGSTGADPWTRAQIAVRGILALNKSQAIYLTKRTDDTGAPLSEYCRYRVSGGPIPGRWWSITVYAADNYLPVNDDDALSFDATEVVPDAQSRWTALLASKREGEGAWASSRNAGTFDITLRVYNPTSAAQADFGMIPAPKVTRIDCGGKS
jgi:hypothetical protein